MQRFDHHFTAMGGPCRLRLDCDCERTAMAAVGAAETEVRRLEKKYSRYLMASLTTAVNHSAGGGVATAIDSETAGLLSYADTLWRESGGLFDLTSGVLRRAWNFKSGTLPAESDIQPLLPLVGWNRVQWDERSVYLPGAGMELDFGGCVKEYGADSAAAVLAGQGIAHALVDLAGDMAAVGGQADGQPWEVGIRDPAGGSRPLAIVGLASGGLASSGDYERKL
jgi:thiamine biosynthesis lipoprotein